MKRDITKLTDKTFDVLVIGGGIHGAVTAWDAALRGLSVALIERSDFGSATSQNSLKIIHGGLRYLQDGNLSRIRKMAYERTTWMNIASHLVHPMPCLTPTRKKITKSRLALTVALTLNDMLSFDRNRLADKEKYLPGGKTISSGETAQILPGYDVSTTTGAAVWHDAQVNNTERLLLEFILSAAQQGAEVANYVEATAFLREGQKICGVKARDVLSGQEFEIQSGVVINCAGAWVNSLLEKASLQSETAVSVAMNVIVDKVWSRVAVGLPSQPGKGKRSQILMIVPWRNKSIIGTWHIHWKGSPDAFKLDDGVIQEFLDEINSAHPQLRLSLQNVHHAHWGFLPVNKLDADKTRVKLMRDDQLIDHAKQDDVSGLISIVSVKYTTARATAEQAVDLSLKKLAKNDAAQCKTHLTPVKGGRIENFKVFLNEALASAPNGVDAEIIEHLVYTYGSDYKQILDYAKEQPQWLERIEASQPVIAAEIVHSARHEMVGTLLDVIQRRTELGSTSLPSMHVLHKAADLVGCELGWSEERKQQEIASVVQAYPFQKMEQLVNL
jgi:glycerol-3-phosphate dehydrogenase